MVLSPADPDPEDLCLEPEAAEWNKKFKYESSGKTPQNFRMSDEETEPIEIPDEPHKIGLPQPNGQKRRGSGGPSAASRADRTGPAMELRPGEAGARLGRKCLCRPGIGVG